MKLPAQKMSSALKKQLESILKNGGVPSPERADALEQLESILKNAGVPSPERIKAERIVLDESKWLQENHRDTYFRIMLNDCGVDPGRQEKWWSTALFAEEERPIIDEIKNILNRAAKGKLEEHSIKKASVTLTDAFLFVKLISIY